MSLARTTSSSSTENLYAFRILHQNKNQKQKEITRKGTAR